MVGSRIIPTGDEGYIVCSLLYKCEKLIQAVYFDEQFSKFMISDEDNFSESKWKKEVKKVTAEADKVISIAVRGDKRLESRVKSYEESIKTIYATSLMEKVLDLDIEWDPFPDYCSNDMQIRICARQLRAISEAKGYNQGLHIHPTTDKQEEYGEFIFDIGERGRIEKVYTKESRDIKLEPRQLRTLYWAAKGYFQEDPSENRPMRGDGALTAEELEKKLGVTYDKAGSLINDINKCLKRIEGVHHLMARKKRKIIFKPKEDY